MTTMKTSFHLSWCRWRRVGSVVLLLLTATQHAVAIQATDEPVLYIVGPSDVLAITVYNQPQLSGRYAVEADGSLAFPLIGRFVAGGLSAPDVASEVRGRLAKGYLRDPQVTVAVAEYRSQQIFVVGEVRQPGSFQLSGTMTLIEALARAGSTTERAGREAVIVRPRRGVLPSDVARVVQAGDRAGVGADAEVIRVALEDVQAGALAQNVALRPGDTIFVPRAETVFVSGQVASSGEYVIRKGMTVRQVLALAGGVTDRGSTRRIQIIRRVNGVEIMTGATLQDSVQAGDTILVRERFF